MGRKPRLGRGDTRPAELSFATGLHQPQGDTSKSIFPGGFLASVSTLHSCTEHHRELHAHADPEQINSNVQHAADWVNSALVYTKAADDDILKLNVCFLKSCANFSTIYSL